MRKRNNKCVSRLRWVKVWLILLTYHLSLLTSLAVSVETDRAWYLSGEAMTLRVSAGDAPIAYAELCDTHRLAAATMVSLKGGVGQGVIELPSSLHSGYYLLSVYTRNSTEVSQQLVAIINPLHRSKDDDIEWIDTTAVANSSLFTLHSTLDSAVANSSLFTLHSSLTTLHSTLPSELEGHIIRARIRNVNEGQTFMASQILPSLSIIGKQIHYFEGKMVNDSTALFYTFGIHGKQPLVLSAMSSTGESLPVEIMSPYLSLLPRQLPHLVFHYNRSEVEARSLDMQRHQLAIAPADTTAAANSSLFTLHSSLSTYDSQFYGTKPDLTYNLDEYRQFLTIREVLLEYVLCVSKINQNGRSRLIVRREEDHYNSSLPTLVLIDGMPVIDTERLLNYDARRVHYINIYGGQYTFGNSVYNGILSFVTRSGQLTNYPVERNMQYLVYDFPE